ncbi:MAG: hypothetical protein HN347_12210 [Bacteroidetes bacterium]|nr:hypothetical protein [Bacteroidota bacterium]
MITDIEKIKRVDIELVLADDLLTRLVLNTYSALWCVSPKFCERSIRLYYSELVKNGIKQFKMKSKKQEYILKKGVRIYWKHEHFTVYNMTDEKAKKLLKENPKLINKFEKMPEKLTAADLIDAINKCETIEQLEKFAGDNRRTVFKAYNDKLDGFHKVSNVDIADENGTD